MSLFQPHDEPILKHLQDVELKLNEKSVSWHCTH